MVRVENTTISTFVPPQEGLLSTPLTAATSTPGLWSIVLAGGAGRRLSSVTGGVPKQFWSPDQGGSLLDRTLARVAPLGAPDRVTIVVDAAHAPYVEPIATRWPSARVVFQPCDRGTAPGVLFSLLPTLRYAPDAIVLLTPSDHGVRGTRQFRDAIRHAARTIERGTVETVLFGARATSPSRELGWIVAGPSVRGAGGRIRYLCYFEEKPSAERAALLLDAGALWSTMVVVARASSLLRLFEAHVPWLAESLTDGLCQSPGAHNEQLRDIYQALPPADFSRDLLTLEQELTVQVWPAAMGWADLGTPGRLHRWMRTGHREDNAFHAA